MNLAVQKQLSSSSFLSGLVHAIDVLARPFIIDLESTNTTHVNDEVIPITRFYELKAGDGALSIPFLPPSS